MWVDTYKRLPVTRSEAELAALRYAHEIPSALRSLRLPVVAINPDNSATDEASLRKHGVEPIIVTGLGHFLMMENPVRFNAVLRSVVERWCSYAGPVVLVELVIGSRWRLSDYGPGLDDGAKCRTRFPRGLTSAAWNA